MAKEDIVYNLITGTSQEFELAGMTLLSMGKPPLIIDSVFETLNQALTETDSAEKQKQLIANAQNLLKRLVTFDSTNKYFPNFTDSTRFSEAMRECESTINTVLNETSTSQEFFDDLAKTQGLNANNQAAIAAKLAQTVHTDNAINIQNYITHTLTASKANETEMMTNATTLANDLKNIQLAAFGSVPMTDFLQNGWTQNGTVARSLIALSTNITNMVENDLLSAKNINHQLKVANFYALVLEQAIINRDYATASAIHSAFISTPIRRLSYISNLQSVQDAIAMANKIFDSSNNRSALRNEIIRKPEETIIPFFGLFGSDLTFSQDGGENIKDGVLNKDKMKILFKTLDSFHVLQTKIKTAKVDSPASNIAERLNTLPKLDDAILFRMAEKSYKKIEFNQKPDFAALLKSLSRPGAPPLSLARSFMLTVPQIPDIRLNYRNNSEKQRVNSGDKPRRSYLYILRLINKSMAAGATLEERFFACEVLRQIQQNIQDKPRLASALKEAIEKTNHAIALEPSFFSDIKQLSQVTDRYVNAIEQENILTQKIVNIDEHLRQFQTALREIDDKLETSAADERPALVIDREATLEKIQSLGTEKNASLSDIEFYKNQKDSVLQFMKELDEKYPTLDSNTASQLRSLTSSLRANISSIDQIDSRTKDYSKKIKERDSLYSSNSPHRIKQLLSVRSEINTIEKFFRESTRHPSAAVADYAKAKLAEFDIPVYVNSANTATPWTKSATHSTSPKPRATAFLERNTTTATAKPAAAAVQPEPAPEPPLQPKPIVSGAAIHETKANSRPEALDFLFSAHAPPLVVNEQVFGQSHMSLHDLDSYLAPPENRLKHDITKITPKIDAAKNVSELEISFQKPDSQTPLKAVAKKGTSPDSLQLSTTKGLSIADFTIIAERIAALSVATAKNNAEFDISISPNEQKRVILKAAFEKAIENAMNKISPQFTNDTKPTLKTSSEPPRSPNISRRHST